MKLAIGAAFGGALALAAGSASAVIFDNLGTLGSTPLAFGAVATDNWTDYKLQFQVTGPTWINTTMTNNPDTGVLQQPLTVAGSFVQIDGVSGAAPLSPVVYGGHAGTTAGTGSYLLLGAGTYDVDFITKAQNGAGSNFTVSIAGGAAPASTFVFDNLGKLGSTPLTFGGTATDSWHDYRFLFEVTQTSWVNATMANNPNSDLQQQSLTVPGSYLQIDGVSAPALLSPVAYGGVVGTTAGTGSYLLKPGTYEAEFITDAQDSFGSNFNVSIFGQALVPEPATWAMMILGVAMIGSAARRRKAGVALAA